MFLFWEIYFFFFVGDVLQCQMEPDNAVGKYTVAVMNKGRAVGHLMKEKSGKFAKKMCSFFWEHILAIWQQWK